MKELEKACSVITIRKNELQWKIRFMTNSQKQKRHTFTDWEWFQCKNREKNKKYTIRRTTEDRKKNIKEIIFMKISGRGIQAETLG